MTASHGVEHIFSFCNKQLKQPDLKRALLYVISKCYGRIQFVTSFIHRKVAHAKLDFFVGFISIHRQELKKTQ